MIDGPMAGLDLSLSSSILIKWLFRVNLRGGPKNFSSSLMTMNHLEIGLLGRAVGFSSSLIMMGCLDCGKVRDVKRMHIATQVL
jgi:hypothetical protein